MIFTTIIMTVIWHGFLWWREILYNGFISLILFFFDIVVIYLILDRLTYFFSQFVLPIQNRKDRKEIYSRVRDFSSGKRGPALFIKNGQLIDHPGEKEKKGPGVVVLDTASAAVLRTNTEFKDTIGPGVKFTKVHKINDEDFNEYLAGCVDLRTQWKFIGPMTNEQPFLNPLPFPNLKEFNDKHERRQQTSGWTRDGFEVSPTIGIKFRVMRLTNIKTDSGVTTRYGFDPDHVRKAILYEPMELGRTENKKDLMKWDELPVHLVVNLWREYVRKFKLEDLFTSKKDEISKLQTIEDMICKRVQKSKVVRLDETGDPLPGEPLESPEYKHLLDRGIEIIEVRIRQLLFDTEIETKMAEQWNGEWLNSERKKEGLLNNYEANSETLVRKKAVKDFASTAADRFTTPTIHPDIYTTLQMLVEPLKEQIEAARQKDNDELENTIKKLGTVLKWILFSKTHSTKK